MLSAETVGGHEAPHTSDPALDASEAAISPSRELRTLRHRR